MKLYFTATSPFVRKVLVSAHELGVMDRIETAFVRPMPMEPNAELSRTNPLSKIPALILEDGNALFDSPVICEYLESIASPKRIIPTAPGDRFRVLRTQALADGILEAAILVFYEQTQRPKELHWIPWISGQTEKARQGLHALENDVDGLRGEIDLGQIAVGAMFGWLDFRGVIPDLRTLVPKLAAWFDAFRERPSMRATEPQL